MKLSFKSLAASCLLMSLAAVHAQDLKIGAVDLDRVMRDPAISKAADARLDSEFNRRKKDLDDLDQRLKTASDKFEKDAPTLAESDRVRRQRSLVDQDRELQRKRREFQEDISQRRNEEMASALDRTKRVIITISEQEKYDLIVEQAVIAGPRVDITDKVIKALSANLGR